MMTSRKILTPVIVLSMVILSCSLPFGNEDTGTLFFDDFSNNSSGWGVGTLDFGEVAIEGGEYIMRTSTSEYFMWGVPGKDFADYRVEVVAKNTGSASDAAFGLICNFLDDNNYYFAGIGSDGYYAIVRTQNATDVVISGDKINWIPSDLIPLNATSYRLGLECTGGVITLFVDGTVIESVNDGTFTSGDVGLFLFSFEQPDAEVRFDDLVVTLTSVND